ncbi:MAG: hypothetical protein ACLTVD_09975, partial [Streptococcus salivarius]
KTPQKLDFFCLTFGVQFIFEGVFYDENILSTVQSIITIPIFHVNIKGLWYNDSDIQGGMP